jgi:hypothetical protein
MIDFFKCSHWRDCAAQCFTAENILLAIAVLVVCILLIAFVFRGRKIFIAKSGGGTISLAKGALRRMVASIAREVGIDGKVHTKIRCCCKRIRIDVAIKTSGWRNLSDVAKALHSRLREVLVDSIGIASIGKINIVIAGISFAGDMGLNSRGMGKSTPVDRSGGDCGENGDWEEDGGEDPRE